jgi:hypothetical protein
VLPTSAGVAPEDAACAAFDAAADASSGLTCPSGTTLSIRGCKTFCLA